MISFLGIMYYRPQIDLSVSDEELEHELKYLKFDKNQHNRIIDIIDDRIIEIKEEQRKRNLSKGFAR